MDENIVKMTLFDEVSEIIQRLNLRMTVNEFSLNVKYLSARARDLLVSHDYKIKEIENDLYEITVGSFHDYLNAYYERKFNEC